MACAVVASFLVCWPVYRFDLTPARIPPDRQFLLLDELIGGAGWMHGVAYWLLELPLPLAGMIRGIGEVYQHNWDGHSAYLFGQLSRRALPSCASGSPTRRSSPRCGRGWLPGASREAGIVYRELPDNVPVRGWVVASLRKLYYVGAKVRASGKPDPYGRLKTLTPTMRAGRSIVIFELR
jgi:hypothetical protein